MKYILNTQGNTEIMRTTMTIKVTFFWGERGRGGGNVIQTSKDPCDAGLSIVDA